VAEMWGMPLVYGNINHL